MKCFFLFIIVFMISLPRCHSQWLPASISLPTNWGSTTSIDASDSLTIALASSLGIYRTTDGGMTWKNIFTNPLRSVQGSPEDISIIDSGHFWVACANGGILATTDGGAQWSLQFLDSTKSVFMDYIKFFDLQSGIAIGDGRDNIMAILHTSDGGNHWQSANTRPLIGWSGDMWRRMDFINRNVGYFYVSGPQTINKTTDGGATWSPTAAQLPYVEVLNFYDQNIGLVMSDSGRIFRTLDGAVSWEEFPSPHKLWGNDIEFAPSDPANVWMTDLIDVYFSSDTGRTWTAQSAAGGRDLVFPTRHSGWFIGDGGKLYHTANGGVTSVEDAGSHPDGFMLYQNFPNPFNPSTSIAFTVNKRSRVRLTIYNILGQTVATLVDSDLAAGLHSVKWNTDAATGIYFYRIEMSSLNNPVVRTSDTKKMLLLR